MSLFALVLLTPPLAFAGDQSETPLDRLRAAVAGRTGKGLVEVLPADVVAVGNTIRYDRSTRVTDAIFNGSKNALKTTMPGQKVHVQAEDLLELLDAAMHEPDNVLRVENSALRAENAALKAELEAAKKERERDRQAVPIFERTPWWNSLLVGVPLGALVFLIVAKLVNRKPKTDVLELD